MRPKKKIDEALRLYFPEIFEDPQTKEWHDLLKRRTMLVLKSIAEGSDRGSEIDGMTGRLLTFSKPQEFSGNGGLEVKQDKDYEDMCLLISRTCNVDAKSLNVLAFYNAYEYLRKEAKDMKRKAAKGRR